jgi:hypothetical protein
VFSSEPLREWRDADLPNEWISISALLSPSSDCGCPSFQRWGGSKRSLCVVGVGACQSKLSIRIAIRTLQEDTVLGIDPIDLTHPKRA